MATYVDKSLMRRALGAIPLGAIHEPPAQEPEMQEPEMSVVLKRLNHEVDALESVLSDMLRRLDPVLQPPVNNASGPPGVTPVHSPLGNMVHNEAVRIGELSERIADALARLAV